MTHGEGCEKRGREKGKRGRKRGNRGRRDKRGKSGKRRKGNGVIVWMNDVILFREVRGRVSRVSCI